MKYPVFGCFTEEYALRIPNYSWPINAEKSQNPKENKTGAQQSGSGFGRRSDGASERRRLKKRRRERYEVRDDDGAIG